MCWVRVEKKGETLVTFTELLNGTSLQEAAGLECPTYYKDEDNSQKISFGLLTAFSKTSKTETDKQFKCSESNSKLYLRYKRGKPPSWSDRIFHSTNQQWLRCDGARRVTHEKDHDAVLVTCAISKGQVS